MLKLKLVKVGKHKIQVIKLIRLFTELGLKESKELMDNAPSILISNREDLSLEQIIKNFKAIGASVEKVIEETPPKDDAVGVDNSYILKRPGAAKNVVKEKEYPKNVAKSATYKKQELTAIETMPVKLKIKPAIVFVIVIAIIKSFLSIYFGNYAFFYAIFIVAIGVAYILRKHNLNEEKKIGTPAFLITLLYFFSVFVADWIILFVLYQYTIPINIFGLIVSLFTTRNILVLVAGGIAYFLAINKTVFKQFLPKTEFLNKKKSNLVENENKKYHKEKKRF